MSEKWSSRFSEQFHVTLTPDVIDWLDHFEDIAAGEHLGEYSEHEDLPQRVFDPKSGAVWAGLMPPDCLPILGNGCGDALLLRFGVDGRQTEVIELRHEGGEWRPYGRTLAEAILCDIAVAKARGTLDPVDVAEPRPIKQWALDQVQRASGSPLQWHDPLAGDRHSVLRNLLDANLCEVAVRQEFCLDALTCELCRRAGQHPLGPIAEQLGVPWSTFWGWISHTSTMPTDMRDRLAAVLGEPVDPLLEQDWERAAVEADKVRLIRPDIGWPYVVLGESCEHIGNVADAVSRYADGLEVLGTTFGFGGFISKERLLDRLRILRDHWPDVLATQGYVAAALDGNAASSLSARVRDYWMHRAEEAEAAGDPARAYRHYFAAGWDLLVYDDMEQVLAGLVRTSEAAGFDSLHLIARHHLACLKPVEQTASQPLAQVKRSRFRSFLSRLLGK